MRQASAPTRRPTALQPRHIVLATVLALFWGFNFVVVTVALGDVPPQLPPMSSSWLCRRERAVQRCGA